MISGGGLEHHGIKGQKWGVRRFENEDGTLTEAGKARYSEAKRIASSGYVTGSTKFKNAIRRGVKGGAAGTAVAGMATFDSGATVTDTLYTSIGGKQKGPKVSSYHIPGKGANFQGMALGFVAGFAGTAIGSVIKDTVHNKRVSNAEKFIEQYKDSYTKTYG